MLTKKIASTLLLCFLSSTIFAQTEVEDWAPTLVNEDKLIASAFGVCSTIDTSKPVYPVRKRNLAYWVAQEHLEKHKKHYWPLIKEESLKIVQKETGLNDQDFATWKGRVFNAQDQTNIQKFGRARDTVIQRYLTRIQETFLETMTLPMLPQS